MVCSSNQVALNTGSRCRCRKNFFAGFLLVAPVREPNPYFVTESLFRRFPNFFDRKKPKSKNFPSPISAAVTHIVQYKLHRRGKNKIQKFITGDTKIFHARM